MLRYLQSKGDRIEKTVAESRYDHVETEKLCTEPRAGPAGYSDGRTLLVVVYSLWSEEV